MIFLLVGEIVAVGQGNKSQSKPNLSGTWMLDPRQSVGQIGKAGTPIKIAHNDPELRISRTFERSGQLVVREFVYYTDGRAEQNSATILLTNLPGGVKPEDIDRQVVKSRTKWDGSKVVTRARLRNALRGHVAEYEMIDEWKLSKDGKTLTETTRFVFQPGANNESILILSLLGDVKNVYRLVSK